MVKAKELAFDGMMPSLTAQPLLPDYQMSWADTGWWTTATTAAKPGITGYLIS